MFERAWVGQFRRGSHLPTRGDDRQAHRTVVREFGTEAARRIADREHGGLPTPTLRAVRRRRRVSANPVGQGLS